MNSLDTVTLKAFVAALLRLESSLPDDLQNELNEIGRTFPSDVPRLHTIAKNYHPLQQEYMDARSALQEDCDRSVIAVAVADEVTPISDEKIISFAAEVLNADDSVNLLQQKYTESSILGQLLFQLRRQTSFMVDRDIQSIPEQELWVWQSPGVWASLERGLRQAQAGVGVYLGSFAQYAELEIED